LVFKEQEEDWDAVCALAVQFGRPLFSNDSMLPFIDVAPKKVIPKQRAQRKQKSQVSIFVRPCMFACRLLEIFAFKFLDRFNPNRIWFAENSMPPRLDPLLCVVRSRRKPIVQSLLTISCRQYSDRRVKFDNY